MNRNLKKAIREAGIIVVLAVILAFAYNIYSPNGIPLIPEEKEVITVSDDELFETNGKVSNQSKPGEENINNNNDLQSDKVIDKDKNEKISKEEADSDENQQEKKSVNETHQATKDYSNTESNDEDLAQGTHDIDSAEVPSVSYEQILKIIESEEFLLIDARHPQNFAENKIGNAINIFPYNENKDEMMQKALELPFDKKIVVYCDGGNCDSSHKLADILTQFGYEKVYIYTGGWEEWVNKRELN